MTLTQLYYVIALDTHRHFRQAASFLGISQPGLSSQLNKLEEELGVSLFNRSAKPVIPTPAGEQVIAQARIILEEAERLKLLVEGETAKKEDGLRIGISMTVAPHVIAQAFAAFRLRFPDLQIDLEESDPGAILEGLKRDTLDAGLVDSEVKTRGLKDHLLCEEPLVCYASDDHPLAFQGPLNFNRLDLADLWLLKPGHPLREQVVALFETHAGGQRPRDAIRFTFESVELLKRMIETNRGATILPWLTVAGEAHFKPGLVRPFERPTPTRTIRLVYPRRLEFSPMIQALALEFRQAVLPLLPPDHHFSEAPAYDERAL